MGRLEDVLEYQMDDMQAKAFKLAILWEQLTEQEFPNYPHVKLRDKGDPRKSVLFRHCYRLVRQTNGIIPDEEYRLYILSQLHVIKCVATNLARIDPVILTGDKAWRRWRLWKRRWDLHRNYATSAIEIAVSAPLSQIRKELNESKKFLLKEFHGKIAASNIAGAVKDKSLVRWVNFESVSPYYVIISPFVAAAVHGVPLDDVFLFDVEVYQRSVTPDTEKLFKQIFPEEFTHS
jgi:hypothetical protein